jgi:chorismate synthase
MCCGLGRLLSLHHQYRKCKKTVNKDGESIDIEIKGRHDPIVVPRAVVVVEAMAAIAVADLMLANMSARIDRIKKFYGK